MTARGAITTELRRSLPGKTYGRIVFTESDNAGRGKRPTASRWPPFHCFNCPSKGCSREKGTALAQSRSAAVVKRSKALRRVHQRVENGRRESEGQSYTPLPDALKIFSYSAVKGARP